MKLHPSITEERIIEAIESSYLTLSNPGFCVACGYSQEGCEPDARSYVCDNCSKPAVFGAEELMFHII